MRIGRTAVLTAARDSSSSELGRRSGRHSPLGAGVGASARDVVEGAGDLQQRDAVDRRVVDLRHDREAAGGQPDDVVEALDDVHLPQRPAPVERPRVQPRHLDAELPPIARAGQGDVPHVVLEVEVRILDPVRVIEPQRHLHEALPERP